MAKQNSNPDLVEIDWGTFKNGAVDVLVHWNIIEGVGITDDGQEYPQWSYDEARLRVPIPDDKRDPTDAQNYLNTRYQALLMLAGADVIPNRIADTEMALLDLAEAIL